MRVRRINDKVEIRDLDDVEAGLICLALWRLKYSHSEDDDNVTIEADCKKLADSIARRTSHLWEHV